MRKMLACLAILSLFGCSYSSINAYIDRWVRIKISVPLEYAQDEEQALNEFIFGYKEAASIEKKLIDSGIQLTDEEASAIKRMKSGNPKLARKIANRGQALRAAIEKYNIRAWENDEKRLKSAKLTDAEIIGALGEKPVMSKYSGGIEVKEENQDSALRTIIVSVQE